MLQYILFKGYHKKRKLIKTRKKTTLTNYPYYPLAVQTEILRLAKHNIASAILSHYCNVLSQGVQHPLYTKYFSAYHSKH